MKIVERHIIRKNHKHYAECDKLCFLAKNVYNHANYIVRQSFIRENTYLQFSYMDALFIGQDNVDYRALPAKVSKGILRILDRNWKSYFAAIKEWKINPDKFISKPKLPKYKNTRSGRFVVPYEKGAVSKRKLDCCKVVAFSATTIEIPTKINYSQLVAARIIPKYAHYVIEVIYNAVEAQPVNSSKILGIDIGVDNLATCASSEGDVFIINGKPLKSINQYYNKKKAKLQSMLVKDKYSSIAIEKLTNKRGLKINDYIHKSSRYIINYCLTNHIGRIVIGHNDNWKQNINIGDKNNQNFVSIPFSYFIAMIKYKAQLAGICVDITEESYTSKCSFVDNESLCKQDSYCGKRVKRGLFKTLNGIFINADVNAAFNIIKKVVPLFSLSWLKYGIEGVAVHPLKICFS